MTLSEYTKLKQQIVLAVSGSEKHGQLVTMLKRLFEDEINSPRRFERIKTIGELLETLEIRDLLSANNVGVLEHTVKRIDNHDELLQNIREYVAAHPVSSENINYYAPQNIQRQAHAESSHQPSDPTSFMVSNPVSTGMSRQKADRIHIALVEEIGSNWRNLGRNLGIAEGKLDNINASNETLKGKACTLLKLYENIADPQRWFFHLCEALERTRRRDLSKKLQEILTMAL